MIGFAILVVFGIAATLMFMKKLPAILALPLMAIAIAAIEWFAGKLTLDEIGYAIFADGALRLADPIVISMLGGMVSLLMQKAGVAEKFIRIGAELAGDNPWMVSMITLSLIAVLFTTIGGLGAVIMVGTIVLPILASLGLRDYVAGAIVLFGISLGGVLNPNNWAMFTSVLKLDVGIVSSFALQMFLVVAFASIVFVTMELWLSGRFKFNASFLRQTGIGLLALVLLVTLLSWLVQSYGSQNCWSIARWGIGIFLMIAMICGLVEGWQARTHPVAKVRWHSFLIPLVPLTLILLYQMPFIPAFLCGFMYGIISTLRRGSLNMISRAVIEGSQSVIPAVILMLGIGMLLNSILGPAKSGPAAKWYDVPAQTSPAQQTTTQQNSTQQPTVPANPVQIGTNPTHPTTGIAQPDTNQTPAASAPTSTPQKTREWPVTKDMEPLLAFAVPQNAFHFTLIFALLAPLALYRGPLNVWGLGYGVGTVLISMGVPPGAVMGILMAVGIVQGVSDPTNTQNVWIANEVRVDVNTLMWRTILYTWGAAILGLFIAGMRFYQVLGAH